MVDRAPTSNTLQQIHEATQHALQHVQQLKPQQFVAVSLALGFAFFFCLAAVWVTCREYEMKGGEDDKVQPSAPPYDRLEEGEAAELQGSPPATLQATLPATLPALVASPVTVTASSEPAAAPAATAVPPPAPAPAQAAVLSKARDTLRSANGLPPAAAPPPAAPEEATTAGASLPRMAQAFAPASDAAAPAPAPAPTSHRVPKRAPSPAKGTKAPSSARATSSPARAASPAARNSSSSGGASRSAKDGSPKVYAFNMPAINRDADSPAPGHYDTHAHSLASRALKTHNKMISSGKGTFMTRLDDDRSAPNMTYAAVDPTAYSDYYLDKDSVGACSKSSSNAQVRDGKIGFNSNVARCVDSTLTLGEKSDKRGPGTYNFDHLYNCGASDKPMSERKSGTTAFTSTAPLLGYVRTIDTPGSGDYHPEKMSYRGNSYSKLGGSAFVGNTARCAEVIQSSSGNLGPETYDQDHASLTRQLEAKHNPRLPPFATSQRRL